MKIETTQDIENLLRMYLASAAVSTALELGLFWQLANKPAKTKEISQKYNIPYSRCACWLELLTELELLEQDNENFLPSSIAHNAIIKSYSQETWAFMAQETSEKYQTINDLKSTISHPNSVWEAQGITPPDYIVQMTENSNRAENFTKMLYELHKPLAEKLAKKLDMTNVTKLMDLGGGSGVISLALLKLHPNLNAIVVDIENVCLVGRNIANETPSASRIKYYSANFLLDDLPAGFDMIIECDVGVYRMSLFQKLRNSLKDGGQLVIISNTNEQGAWIKPVNAKPSLFWFLNTFLTSLEVPKFETSTIKEVETLLIQAGYQNVNTQVDKDGFVFIRAVK